jgi:hypothetical protein
MRKLFRSGIQWSFETARFTVELECTRDYRYRYDGDDPDGEVQTKLDTGEYIAFDSCVRVLLDGEEIGVDYLGGSVYDPETAHEFWTMHRSPDPMHRNCSIMRAKNGGNVCIGHYFPDMVSEAIREARKHVAGMRDKPKLRINQ